MAVIDTLEIAEELARDGVFTREQAERLARVSARTAAEALVTKADLDAAVRTLRGEIAGLRSDVVHQGETFNARLETNTALLRQEFDAKLQAMAKELVKWFAGIMLAHGITVIGVTVALIKLL